MADHHEARRQQSRHGPIALIALLVPAIGLPIGLMLLARDPRFAWLTDPWNYPWQFWAVAVCGTIATAAGIVDWRIHRSGTTVVGVREHRAHVIALVGGGIPLFVLLAIASVIPRPVQLLIPVVVMLIATVVAISYDEFVFHRRCKRFEILMHRLLTVGNGLAFLAWAHWCFVRGGIDA